MKDLIRQAFLTSREGFSADRVVADPDLNAKFIAVCRSLGLDQEIRRLNKALLNARKGGWLAGASRPRATSFADIEDYRFASEVATRLLEQKHRVSLDDIICDPVHAAEFDAIAAGIAPGFDSLRYRWAALNLRKTRRLKPEILSRVVLADLIELGRVETINAESIPVRQGLYVFYAPTETLYVGEAENLRKRVAKHLDHSDNRGLAHWLWERGVAELQLELRLLPVGTATRVRRALEAELISSRRPRFNIQSVPK